MSNEVVLNAVGDVWFGDHPVTIGHGVRSIIEKRGSDYIFEMIGPVLKEGDINFCNLESVLSDKGLKRWLLNSLEMRGFPDCIEALKNGNFGIVNVANNHIMQHGKEAFRETINLLEKNSIKVLGLEIKNGTKVHCITENDIQLVFCGFSLHPEEYYVGKLEYSYRNSKKKIIKEVRKIRREHNGIMVVSLHWGNEFMTMPSPKQIEIGREIVDEGVSVVLGHHPHVLQPIERYRKGIIAYSLGNFLFDMWGNNTKESIILKIIIENNQKINFNYIPIVIGRDYRPRLAPERIAREVKNRVSKRVKGNRDSERYEVQRKIIEEKYRKESHRYFLKNIRKYSINMILQSIVRTIMRRFRIV